MAEAKIKTLYSDKEKTEKLYPRTKIGAISDNDGVGLEAILDNMVYSSDVAVESVQASLPVDADTLGGHTPDYYATKADLVGLGSETQIVTTDLQSQIDNITPEQIGAAPTGDYATKSFVTNKIAEAQLSGEGEIDLSGYATKDDIANIDYPVDSVNGRTGAVQLSAGDVGARPDNWMPTAEQVGARPNTWLPTLEQIGAAPAGYGLGEVPDGNFQATPGNIDTLLAPGWYNYYDPSYGALAGLAFSGGIMVVPRFVGVFQYFFPRGSHGNLGGCYAVREYADGVWDEWCVENPPMVLGVEYRTTERWQGKAVYAMLVDCRNMPDGNTYKAVEVEVDHSGVVKPIACVGQTSENGVLPIKYVDGNEQWMSATRGDYPGTIKIDMYGGVASWTATALVKYVKL